MAKKSRRAKKPRLSPAQRIQPAAEIEAVSAVPIEAQPDLQAPDLREEYGYVVTDLRRIGLIAAVMLAALVSLAFLLV
jgi:hypothetical protein